MRTEKKVTSHLQPVFNIEVEIPTCKFMSLSLLILVVFDGNYEKLQWSGYIISFRFNRNLRKISQQNFKSMKFAMNFDIIFLVNR